MGKNHSGIVRTLGVSAIIIGLLNGITPATAGGMGWLPRQRSQSLHLTSIK